MISRFIQTEVKVSFEVWINLDTMRKPNSITVLLYNSEIVANLDEDAITVPAECRQFSCRCRWRDIENCL